MSSASFKNVIYKLFVYKSIYIYIYMCVCVCVCKKKHKPVTLGL